VHAAPILPELVSATLSLRVRQIPLRRTVIIRQN
jgi:hypothetical protein